MKTLLVNPPIRLPEDFAHYPTFSVLGVLCNAAWLRNEGREVDVVDALTLTPRLVLRHDGGGFRHVGAEVEEFVDAVAGRMGGSARGAVVVAVTMFSDMNRMAETLVPRVTAALRERMPDAAIGLSTLHVCGLNYFPFEPAPVLEALPEVDFILMGEGEPTLPELLDRVERGEPLEGLPRVAHRGADGRVVYDPRAPALVKHADLFPLPAFDLLDMDRWFAVQADAIRADLVHEYHVVERQLPLMTSRGCPYRCNFCTNQVLALPWRSHSIEYVCDALRTLRDRYRVDRFFFLDDNINVDEKRFRKLVHALAEIGVPWDAVNGYRADHLDREMVQAIARAGNTKITVSAESGDPAFLDQVIGKRLKLPKVVALARVCEEERVPLQVHYIVVVPGETKEQINKTLELATVLFEKHGAWPLLQHAIPFPGTELFRACEENGWFARPPFEVSGSELEVHSIIRTPDLEPGEVDRMKRNAQRLHAAIQALPCVPVETRCSNRCLSCHCAPAGPGDAPPTREAIRAAFERARFLGGREVFLGGGEPTLRADLPEIVREAREAGFERVALITNAHGLAGEGYAERLLSARVDRLVVDLLAADPELHDRIARRPGAFAGTVKGLGRAAAHGGVTLDFNVPVLRDNLEVLARTVRRARQLGASSVHLQVPPPDSRACEAGRIPTWAEALPFLEQALSAGPRGTVDIQGAPLCLLPEHRGAIQPLPPWELARTRNQRARHPECAPCPAFILCGGFHRSEHEAVYGMRVTASG